MKKILSTLTITLGLLTMTTFAGVTGASSRSAACDHSGIVELICQICQALVG